MAVSTLMVDVDGVVVRRPDGRPWHADLAADLGIDPDALQARFFRVHWDDVVSGRADLVERLERVLPELGEASVDDLVTYWFEKDSVLDQQLLDDLAEVRARGLDPHLATVQEHRRAHHLWETVGLRRHFTAIHYAAELGHSKIDEAFYRAVEARTARPPDEHLLIDDSPANVDAARNAGWRAELWTPTSTLADVLTGS